MASTHSNKFSSRSHAIIQISMERTQFSEKNESEESPSEESKCRLILILFKNLVFSLDFKIILLRLFSIF